METPLVLTYIIVLSFESTITYINATGRFNVKLMELETAAASLLI